MTSEGKHSVLEAVDLSIGYKHKKKITPVSENIIFSIQKGELVGVGGANGIGKSTLIRSLTGMQPTLAGEIFIDDEALKSMNPLLLATKLSVVLTEPPASKNLSVLELVSLGRQPHTNWLGTLSAADKTAILFALEATEIIELKQKKCYELSDGQLQRVLIARALAQDTPIIILDEPTTHLDLYHRAYILKLLRRLASETQKTILFSTHEIDLAIQMRDAMLVMTNDKTYFDSPENLIKQGVFEDLFPKEII
jgi:iron complex transport system ATP-binding protein